MTHIRIALLAGALAVAPGAAQAATLIHAYEFDGAGVVDSVGGVNGTLVNGATVSGGLLHLDGIDDFVQLAGKVIPTDGSAYSVYIKYDLGAANYGYGELISQGYSGGPGFYIGYAGSGRRLTDGYGGGTFDFGAHDLLLTTMAGETKLYIDGVDVLTLGGYLGLTSGGDDTRIGTQFGGYAEYVNGTIDRVRVFSGVASYAEAIRPLTAVPEPGAWALMIGGFALAGGMLRGRGRPAIA